jgi:pyrroline-5-carboxylate reductase
MIKYMKIGFIGLGNMAGAMIGGLIKNKTFKKEEIIGTDISKEVEEKVKAETGIEIGDSNKETARKAHIIVLSVKPQYYEDVIGEIRFSVREEQMIITIAPGKTIEWLEGQFKKQIKIVRCMPNTPALIGEGCTGVCCNKFVTESEKERVIQLFHSFGKAYEVEERLMDAVVGVSGSSPAYVFLFIEAMADAAVKGGMPRQMAYEFAAQAVIGSAKMIAKTKKHPGELKDMVCSPAGTTIEAVRVLEERGFRSAVIEAVGACIEKSKNI